MRYARTCPSAQRGAALLVALCVILALMLLGASATRAALQAEKAARSERDRGVALQAAEAALVDAERDIEGGADPGSLRAAMFSPGVADTFPDGCGSGASNPALGLCKRRVASAAPAWQTVALDAPGGAVPVVDYGTFTGATMPLGKATLPARAPRYIIEPLALVRAGDSASRQPPGFFRITAIGFGARAGTQVVLQSFYLKADADEEGA